MAAHNRDDEKQPEEKQQEEEKQDYIPKPKPKPIKKFNHNWLHDLLLSKQISKRFYKRVQYWQEDLSFITSEIAFWQDEHDEMLSAEKISKKLVKWINDKFDLLLRNNFSDYNGKFRINYPNNNMKQNYAYFIISSLLGGEIYGLPSAYIRRNPFLKPVATGIYNKLLLGVHHPIMEEFFRDGNVDILLKIDNFEEIFTRRCSLS